MTYKVRECLSEFFAADDFMPSDPPAPTAPASPASRVKQKEEELKKLYQEGLVGAVPSGMTLFELPTVARRKKHKGPTMRVGKRKLHSATGENRHVRGPEN